MAGRGRSWDNHTEDEDEGSRGQGGDDDGGGGDGRDGRDGHRRAVASQEVASCTWDVWGGSVAQALGDQWLGQRR